MKTERIDRICLICKKKFKARKDEIKKGYGRFCSQVCYGLWRETLIGKKNPLYKKVKKYCILCGKIFFAQYKRRKSAKYCSGKCRDLNHRNKKKVICPICRKRFIISFADFKRMKTNKCCSQKCRSIKMSKTYIQGKEGHYLKNQSSFIVVVLKSLRHGSCVQCNEPIKTLEESEQHWEKMLLIG